jgi:hypothetical protein
MKLKSKFVNLNICVALLLSLNATATEVGNAEWKIRMRGMLGDVLALFPFAFQSEKLSDPKNILVIRNSLQSLAKYSSELKKHTAHLKVDDNEKIDPSFSFIAEAFESEIKLAQSNFAQGGGPYSQGQIYLRSAITKCIFCHTQSSNGPELKLEQFKSQFEALAPNDRFMALAATRHFDEAISQFEQSIRDAKVNKPENSVFDQSAHVAIAMLVRVKKDPKRAIQLIDKISASDAGTNVLRNDLVGWKKSFVAWQIEKPKLLTTDQALLDEAKRLTSASKNSKSLGDNQASSDMTMLRASSFLHDLLSNFPKSRFRAEAYLMLASAYDSLPGFTIWDLADEYLEACIFENPHSEIAEKCFDRYETSITVGYTGSSGTHIPFAVKQHLTKMQSLSTRIAEAAKKKN